MKYKLQSLELPAPPGKQQPESENGQRMISPFSGPADSYLIGFVSSESPLEHLAVTRRIQSQAMAWLYEKYARFIYSLSLRIVRNPAEAEDVLQEVLFRIWRCPEQLKVAQSLRPWIAVVSRNSSIDIVRRRRASVSMEDVRLEAPNNTALEAEINIMCRQARAVMDALPLEQRIALEMAYFFGMTHAEIANETGSPLGTIKTRIRDALKNLRKNLPLRKIFPDPSSL